MKKMAKYEIIEVNRRTNEARVLEVTEARKIEDARVYASHKYKKIVVDFMNTALVVRRKG